MSNYPIAPLRDLCNNFKEDIVDGPFGANLKREHYKTEGIPVLKIQNIKPFNITLKKMDFVDVEKYEELKRHSYRSGDIIMTKLGNPLGESAIVKNIEDGLIVADLVRIRAQKIDTRYLCYHLNSPITNEYINSQQKGTTRPRVRISVVRDLPIFTPSLEEQKRIVAILDQAYAEIEKARANTEQNLKNVHELFESYLQQVFSQRGEDWVDTNIEKLVNDGVLDKPLDGNHGEIHPKKADFVDVGVPFIMASDIKEGSVDTKGCKFISRNQADSLRKGFAKNRDVLLSHKATIGRSAILNTKLDYVMLTPQVTYYRVLDRSVLSNEYVYWYFNNPIFLNELKEYAGVGSTRAYIGITKQRKLNFSYPVLEEQNAIVSKLNRMSKELRQIAPIYSSKLHKIGELKKSILQKAFTGKLANSKGVAV